MSAKRPLRVTLLASEWKSSKGGLSTLNRELAIQFAKHPNVSVTLFVPNCSQTDKRVASIHNVRILEAEELPGYDEADLLAFPPKDLVIDFVVGHGVVLGKYAQIIRNSHNCKWLQVVHTAPDELAMYKNYPDAIPKGEEKQWDELRLCERADLVVAVGPKLMESYSAYLSSCGKEVHNLTPGIFTELSSSKLSTQKSKFRILVFGRGDCEDFQLKGFDIAAQAVGKLNDHSYRLTFVGAREGSETQVANSLLEQGLSRRQLTVYRYHEDRERLTKLLCASNLAIIPSRTEGFGLTGLEALSAGLPFLVSQNSGFGEAIQEIPFGSSFIVDSEDPECWGEAIKNVRQKGSERAIQECRELRTRYAEKYSWEKQCNDLVQLMLGLVDDKPRSGPLDRTVSQQMEGVNLTPVTTPYDKQGAKTKEKISSRKERGSKSNREIRTCFSCFFVKVSGQESTEACPFQKRGEASGEKLELKVKNEQSVISSMLQQHHVSNENPVKDQLSSDPLKPEDVGLQHFQSIEPHRSSTTVGDGKTERKSLDIMGKQTLEGQNTQSSRDQEKDFVHDLLQGKSRTTAIDTKTVRDSFDIKTRTSDGQNTETRCDKQKDSEHHALQTNSSTTDGDVKTEINSLDIETQTPKKQNTRAKSDQEKDSLLHTLQTDCSTADGDAKAEKNSFDMKTKTSEGQNTQTRRDQDKDSVPPPQFQTDETQPESFEVVTSSHEKQEKEQHISTSDDYVQITDQLSSDPLKPEDVVFQHFQSIEPHGSSGTDVHGKTERKSLAIMETQTLERQNTQSSRDQEKDSVHNPLQEESRTTAVDTKTEKNSFDIKTRTSDGQNTKTRCDKQKDSEHHALQTNSSTTDGDVKTEKHSLDIEAQTSKEQNTRAKSDQEKDSLLHTLQTDCSTTDEDVKTEKHSLEIEAQTSKEQNTRARSDQEKDSLLHTLQTESSTTNGDVKTEKHSVDMETKTSERQNTQTRSDQDKDSVRPSQFQTDEPESFEFVTSAHEKKEAEEDIDTSDDHSQIQNQPSSDPLKPEGVGFKQFQSVEPQGSSTTDAVDVKTEINSLGNKTQTDEEQNTQARRDRESDSVHHPFQTDRTQFLRTKRYGEQQKTEEHIDTSDDDVPKFNKRNMDGRKRFTFSWNQKHREILEEVKRHSFDSRKKGKKFEHQQRRRLSTNPPTPPPSRAAAHIVTSTRRQSSLPESPRVEDKFRGMRCHITPGIIDQEIKDIAIFGCNVSEESLQSVLHVLGDIRPKLNLSENPQVKNRSPAKVERYLRENVFRFCVLVVGAETVKDVYDDLPERKMEYEELLKTAVDRVAEKVIIFVCETCLLRPNETSIINGYIERVFEESSKGFVAWLKDGKLTVEPDVLAQFLNSPKPAGQIMPQRSYQVAGQASVSSGQHCLAQTPRHHVMQPLEGNTTSGMQGQLAPIGKPIMLKSKLYYGRISDNPDDIDIQWPEFKVPELIATHLLKERRHIAEAEVEIVEDREFAYGEEYVLRFPIKVTGNVEYGMIHRASEVKEMTFHYLKRAFERFT